jgi:hypothetical protein
LEALCIAWKNGAEPEAFAGLGRDLVALAAARKPPGKVINLVDRIRQRGARRRGMMAPATRNNESGGGQRMAQRNAWQVVLGLGVLVVLVSALADVLRIGGEPGFGYKQGAGVFVGIALIIAGVLCKPRR